MMAEEFRYFDPDDAVIKATKVLQGAGLPVEAARDAARVMVDADLRGHASHGLALLPLYLERIHQGGIRATASPILTRHTEAVFSIDADAGIGAHAARVAAELVSSEAIRSGICAVAVRNNNHIGMLSAYRSTFQDAGIVGLILNISAPLIAPPGGSKATLGSNALCLIVPQRNRDPFCVDMGTGIVAAGKIRAAARQGRSIPALYLLDPTGQPTTDPGLLDKGGAIPIFGGHKGLSVHLVIEILAGAIAGATLSKFVVHQGKFTKNPMNCSQLFIGMCPSSFNSMDLDNAIDALQEAVRDGYIDEPQEQFFPGQGERYSQNTNSAKTISVALDVVNIFEKLDNLHL